MARKTTKTSRLEQAAYERLKAELIQAYSAPDSAYAALTANDVVSRNKV